MKIYYLTGVTSQIMSMLREARIGYHYFDIAMISYDKRQSMVSSKRNRFKGLGWCRLNFGVKTNFKEKLRNNLSCQVCLSHTDSQERILTCSALNTENETTNYLDLFSHDLNKVVPALKQF